MFPIFLALSLFFSCAQEKSCIEKRCFSSLEKNNFEAFLFAWKLSALFSGPEKRNSFQKQLSSRLEEKINREWFLSSDFRFLEFLQKVKSTDKLYVPLINQTEITWILQKQYIKAHTMTLHLLKLPGIQEELVYSMLQRVINSYLNSNQVEGLLAIYPFAKELDIAFPQEKLQKERKNQLADAEYLCKKGELHQVEMRLKWVLMLDGHDLKARTLLTKILQKKDFVKPDENN